MAVSLGCCQSMLAGSLGLRGAIVHDYTQALQGGILIGLASWILLAGVGRASAVSAITAGVLTTRQQSSYWRWAFLIGLVAGGATFAWLLDVPRQDLRHVLALVPAGFLVGFGAVLCAGSFSGHAVVGLGRRSMRSLLVLFVIGTTAIMTVLVAVHLPSAEWWSEVLLEALHWLFGRQ